MIKKHWWKALGVVLLIYAFTVGLLVPLKPGIQQVSPRSADAGTPITVLVNGYNTSYPADPTAIRAWLKVDSIHALAANSIRQTSRRAIELDFVLPASLPSRADVMPASLIIDEAQSGVQVLPDAVFIRQQVLDPAAGNIAWSQTVIQDLHKTSGMNFPFRNILKETIRNTYFHVSLWFAMLFLFIASVYYSIKHLRTRELIYDHWAESFTRIGVLFGILGLTTGAVWARFTWGAFWSWDIKQNMTAIALLIYLAYFVLRNSFEDAERQARLGASYNIFAFSLLIPLIYIIPRLSDSLHPGSGGNPAFGSEDLDNTMRMVFYPAIIGWTLLGYWLANLSARLLILREKYLSE
ncbi:MAG: cytochrome c biogenesis protein CcsA [Saprospiraceae bacterium]|nr:cytochrome c biogenesis protein CcsA [Saprospiraceae bacterium]